MLSYQHGYHAGNFADVIKHLTLTCLINYMVSKDKPMFYLDTHAGRGVYDLKDEQALKTGEAQQGIARVWDKKDQLPPVFSAYLQHLIQLNSGHTGHPLRYYPGSPWIAANTLRAQDRMVCADMHSGEFEYLQALPHSQKRVFFKQNDGLQELKALLPPTERRGLIFVDPSYEVKTEYRQIPEALKAAYHRFATGVYCIWYPIVDKKYHAQILQGFKNIGAENNLCVEFYLTSAPGVGMTGCGLWVINPPYLLASQLKPALDALRKVFNPGTSYYSLQD